MAEGAALTWDEMVGERVRARREGRGWLQQQLAREMGSAGIAWQRGTVAAVEGGHRKASAPELVILAGIFDRPLWRFLLADDDGEPVSIRGEMRQPRDVVLEMGTGAPVHRTLAAVSLTIRDGEDPRANQSGGPERGGASGTESDVKAARALGVEVGDLQRLAVSTWGHSLEVERDARVDVEGASARTVQARRGHVTRRLVEELRAAGGTS